MGCTVCLPEAAAMDVVNNFKRGILPGNKSGCAKCLCWTVWIFLFIIIVVTFLLVWCLKCCCFAGRGQQQPPYGQNWNQQGQGFGFDEDFGNFDFGAPWDQNAGNTWDNYGANEGMRAI